MEPTPLTLAPILKQKIWGGQRLQNYGKVFGAEESIGESWELADLPDSIEGGRSVIDQGVLAGKTVRSLLEDDPTWIMGRVPLTADGGFPLLIKFLDARENLSVQVHPDEAYVQEHPETHLKTESWIVLDAEEDSVIYKGIRPGIEPRQFAAAINDGSVVDLIEQVPAVPGACHDLPSGTCHALGAGILVAEIQTPSDTTFRVFDWGRSDRALHVEEAMKCIAFEPASPPCDPRVLQSGTIRTTLLSQTTHYVIERIDAIQDLSVLLAPDGAPEVLMMLAGSGTLSGREPMHIEQGRTILLPAALQPIEATLSEGTSFLRITIPNGKV